ncbi:MAG TPA: TMEM165/GDT1 family protein [Bacillota bacterium]|nr:TMEM165/GDT1 family protein [Bacillota bacterium]
MNAFWLSMGMIFLAELGDKTQLVALTLATRYNAKVVLWGIFCATLAVHVFSAGIGWLVGGLLPTNWIQFIAGLAFIGFGFWTLRGDSLDEEEGKDRKIRSAFWLVFVTFFLAELGDKTMLSTVTLATNNAFIPVWLGSTIGMVLSDGLAIVVGKVLGAKLPERVVKVGAAVIFFGFGLFSLIQGGMKLPFYIWIVGGGLAVVMGYFFLGKVSGKKNQPKLSEEAAAAKVL